MTRTDTDTHGPFTLEGWRIARAGEGAEGIGHWGFGACDLDRPGRHPRVLAQAGEPVPPASSVPGSSLARGIHGRGHLGPRCGEITSTKSQITNKHQAPSPKNQTVGGRHRFIPGVWDFGFGIWFFQADILGPLHRLESLCHQVAVSGLGFRICDLVLVWILGFGIWFFVWPARGPRRAAYSTEGYSPRSLGVLCVLRGKKSGRGVCAGKRKRGGRRFGRPPLWGRWRGFLTSSFGACGRASGGRRRGAGKWSAPG